MSNKKRQNKVKNRFLSTFPEKSIESSNLVTYSKFNFSFFDAQQEAGQDFCDWTHKQLTELLVKIKNYTNHPLSYWTNERCGGSSLNTLEYYGEFPIGKSDFKHPLHVPHDVCWSRFRMGNLVRLIGFVIPNKYHGKEIIEGKDKYFFDSNTFYVVFLDRNHKFYKTEKK